jgi:quercetin dioxygenase-like cupin family protein
MKPTFAVLTALIVAISGSAVMARSSGEHKIVQPQEIKWGPAPAALPAGAQAAVLLGDPGKEGLFVLRLKVPKGYRVPPHMHPVQEVVTVISGTFNLGMGETADQTKAQPLPAGSFSALPPNQPHYVFIDEETVIQISTIGPWGLKYVNPKDDPRQKTQ